MKTHLHDPEADDIGRQLQTALCGLVAVDCTDDAEHVTCKLCLGIMADRQHRRDRVRIGWDEAMRDLATVIGGPPVESYPELTPDGWRSMRCRLDVEERKRRPCYCEWCLIDASNARVKADWEASQQVRPHRRYDHVFGSVNAALELLLRWKQDGAPNRSSHGSVQSRAQETARLGTQVQTTQHATREDITTRRATQAIDVERAVRFAYAEDQARRGLTEDVCATILLDSVDPDGMGAVWWSERLGVTEEVIKGVVRHGRKRVTIRLAATGYIPEPRDRAGLGEEIRRERERGAA